MTALIQLVRLQRWTLDEKRQNLAQLERLAARGMKLDKAVDPDVFNVGFNMIDDVVGTPAGRRGRKLRQAMSLAIDSEEFTRLFFNSRGVQAQSPIPPGIFGYEEDFVNPYRVPDLERARELLATAVQQVRESQ